MQESIEKDFNKRKKYFPLKYFIAWGLLVCLTFFLTFITIKFYYNNRWFFILLKILTLLLAVYAVSSPINPDYKVSWVFVILTIPILGAILYLIFLSEKPKRRTARRLKQISNNFQEKNNSNLLKRLKEQDKRALCIVNGVINDSKTNIYENRKAEYFSNGEKFFESLKSDLIKAKKFIFLEYFVIKEGKVWQEIKNILINKANQNVEIRIVYDHFGCMTSLPENFKEDMKKHGIKSVAFSPVSVFSGRDVNNRNHRKIAVIDGKIAYTGGINLADEYVNRIHPYGYWKDCAVKVTGECVAELTKLAISDYELNLRSKPLIKEEYFPRNRYTEKDGYALPFGDGPSPICKRNTSKNLIINMLGCANEEVCVCSPYLIIDGQIISALIRTAQRGVSVKVFLPSVPDKKLIYLITESFSKRLAKNGVQIYNFSCGFLHSKSMIVDKKYALIGTVNLDYRSLAHHYEDGILFINSNIVNEVLLDIETVSQLSEKINIEDKKDGIIKRIIVSALKIIAPLL